MILTCPACTARYEVNAAKFPPSGRMVRCAKCGHQWHAEPSFEATPFFSPPEPDDSLYQRPIAPEPEPEETAFSDSEPQEEEAVYDDTPKLPSVPWYTKKPFLIAGWASLGVVVLVVAVAATVYRQEVVEAWPKAGTIYSHLGAKVEPLGLKLGNTKTVEAPQNGQIVLTVSGAVTNVANRELPVPQIRVGLVDREKRELYHWTVAPGVMTLKPGQSTRFVTRLSNPPEKATSYEVRFAKAGE